MSESIEHRVLVEELSRWILEELLENDRGYLRVDNDSYKNSQFSSLVVNGFRPDVFAYVNRTNLLVIGEAKTISDIDREHSILQYRSYYDTCMLNTGESYLVFAVPFGSVPRLKNVLRNAKITADEKIKIRILEFLCNK